MVHHKYCQKLLFYLLSFYGMAFCFLRIISRMRRNFLFCLHKQTSLQSAKKDEQKLKLKCSWYMVKPWKLQKFIIWRWFASVLQINYSHSNFFLPFIYTANIHLQLFFDFLISTIISKYFYQLKCKKGNWVLYKEMRESLLPFSNFFCSLFPHSFYNEE